MTDANLVFAQNISKAQQEFANQQKVAAETRIEGIITEVQKLCMSAAQKGDNYIETSLDLSSEDYTGIFKRAYIKLSKKALITTPNKREYETQLYYYEWKLDFSTVD